MSKSSPGVNTTRAPHLQWVPIEKMKVSTVAQRRFDDGWAATLTSTFDIEKLGYPVLSHRDDAFYIIDGQHRIAALKGIGYGDQNVQCEVYEGLTEAQEAAMFDGRNARKNVKPFDTFRIRIVAGRDEESDIDRIVRANGLRISENDAEGSIGAVGALRKVYRMNPVVLGRTLRIVRESFGDRALNGKVIEGVGLVCHRFNGAINDTDAVDRLTKVGGGVNGLMHNAQRIRANTGHPLPQCVAGAVVEVLNRGRGGKKLPSWWS